MGTAAIFDTLQYAKKLKEAGFTEQQAEARAEALREVELSRLDQLATKEDFIRLEGEIKLLKWMMGVVLAGIISLVLKAFFA